MICPNCGTSQELSDVTCRQCGSALKASEAQQQVIEVPTPTFQTAVPHLTGFGGWLIVFCIGLALGALRSLLSAVQAHDLSYVIASTSWAAVCVTTGVLISTCNRNAIKWLWVFFTVCAILAMFSFFGIAGFARAPYSALRQVLYIIVWFAYFNASERVALTFGRNL